MILFVSRMPPASAGSGGSQRAMHLLQAVSRHGQVDFLQLNRGDDVEPASDALDLIRPLVRNCQRLQIDEWAPAWARPSSLPWKMRLVREALTMKCGEAPRFSSRTMDQIGALLPERRYDLVFACRLSSAWIVDALISRRLLAADAKVADLDDLLSVFRRRQLGLHREGEFLPRLLQRLEVGRIEKAEAIVARTWGAVSLAAEPDAMQLGSRVGRRIHVIPNVVDKAALPPPSGMGTRILFVGHLSYGPNRLGLERFFGEIWPNVVAQVPSARLDVVGVRPDSALVALAAAGGAQVHADVPSVEPFYGACDIVIAPIWDGGGTRIKILEALAYGRPVVSTKVGAEGLHVRDGVHALIADEPKAFADALVRLMQDPGLRLSLSTAGRRFQQDHFRPEILANAVDAMIGSAVGS